MNRAACRAAALALFLTGSVAAAAPFTPASGTQVLEVLPLRAGTQQQELHRLRAQVAAAPRDPAPAAALAQFYIAQGRAETDPRYYGYAQAALAPWWKAAAPPVPVRLLRATLLQATHRFPEALADLAAVTRADPGNPQAWLTLATVQAVRADYPAALASCAHLSALADDLVTTSCLANTGALTGKLAQSDALLDLTLRRSGDADPAAAAWAQTLLAEMARMRCDTALADARFITALRAAPRDSYLLGAYADFLLDQHREGEVIALLSGFQRIDALLLRYAIALKQRHDTAALAQALGELDARFAAAARRGDSIHQREQARWLLVLHGDPRAALGVARQNWEVQKEPADARILLESARAAGDSGAARPVLAWMTASHIEDRTLRSLAAALRSPT